MPFKPGEGRPPMNISESEIRYAMENSQSCMGAARFLKVSYEAFRKYAKMYTDKESGKLEGKYPKYPHTRLKQRILKNGLMEEECCSCGYCTRRVSDYTVPLLLDWIDGDRTNHKRENLRLLCYNCYYQEVGNPLGGRMRNNY